MARPLNPNDLALAFQARQQQQQPGYGALGGFIASALSAAGPEFVGLSEGKSNALRRWEGEHRIANFASDLLGFGLSYAALTAATGGVGAAGGLGALGRIPRVAKTANRALGTLRASGRAGGEILSAGAKEMLRFAPVEAARLGLATAVGDPGVVARQLPVNMLAIGGIGGVAKAAKLALPFNSPILRSEGLIADLHPEFRPFQRNQLRFQQLLELRAKDAAEGKLTPEITEAYRVALEGGPAIGGTEFPGLKQAIQEEVPETGVRAAVRQLSAGESGTPKKLNELFKLTPLSSQKYFTSRFLNHRKGGVPNTPNGAVLLEETLSGIPEEGWGHMQFPRLIDTAKVAGPKAKLAPKLAAERWKKVERIFEDANHIDDLSYYKELESGMFVVLKRTGDTRGVIFKTDNLGIFSPTAMETPAKMGAQAWAINPNEYNIGQVLKDLGPLADDLRGLLKAYPRYLDLTGRTPGETLEKLANVMSPETRLQGKRVTRFFREAFKKGFAPWLHVTSSSPSAVRLSSIGRQISSLFHAAAAREFGGKVTIEMLEEMSKAGTLKAPIRNILGKTIPTKGGIHARVQALSEGDLSQFYTVLAKGLQGKDLSPRQFSKELISFVKALQRLDERTVKKLMAVQKWTGAQDFKPLARHMMMARLWTGSFRVRIVDANGRFLGMGSGHTKPAAIADALEVAETANRNLMETGTVEHIRSATPQRLRSVHHDLATKGELAPRGKHWAYDGLASPGEAIYESSLGGSVVVRRAEGSRGRVVFEATVPEGPPTLGKYSTPKEAAEAVDRYIKGKGTKGPIEAQTWEVLQQGHEEDLRMVLDPKTGLSNHPASIDAMDRAFGEVLEKKIARWKERKGAIGYKHYHKPLKRDDIEEMILANLITSYRYMSGKVRDKLFEGEMAHLSMVNPAMAKEIQKRFARLDGVSGPITKQINKSVDALLAPMIGPESATRISGALTNAMFRMTLTAGDIGFPVVNAMTFLQTVYPEIALVRDLPAEALQHLYSTSLVATKKGVETFSHVSPRRIINTAWAKIFKASSGKDPELHAMIQRAAEDQIVSPRFVEEYLGKLRENVSLNKANIGESFFEFIKAMDSYMAGKSEQVSRLHAFITGNIVGEMILPGLKGEQLYNFAREFTERTMFLYNQAGRATAFTGPIGSAVGLFKNWPLHYLGNLAGYMGAGFRYGHWKPLAWAMMGTGSLAGVGGIPLYGVADATSRILTDETLMNNLYTWMGYDERDEFGKRAIDSIYYGLPAWAGITFQGRAEAPSSDLARDLNQMGSMMAMDRAVATYRALGEFFDTWEATGQSPFRNPRVRMNLARAFLPRTAYRLMQRTAQGAIASLNTGSPLISDVSLPEHIWYSFGITSTDIQRARDVQNHYFNDKKKLDEMVSLYGQMLADARLEGNLGRRRELWKQAILLHNLPVDKVANSEQGHFRHRTRPDSASQLPKQSQAEIRRIYGD